jgi:transposase
MDESRFGLHTVMRCWGLRGHPVIKRCQQRHKGDYVYGAIDILSGEPVSCHLPTVSANAAWQFLRGWVKVSPDAHHVVRWDGAGFHQPPESTEPAWADFANVHPLTLPPYCPELNPTEKV